MSKKIPMIQWELQKSRKTWKLWNCFAVMGNYSEFQKKFEKNVTILFHGKIICKLLYLISTHQWFSFAVYFFQVTSTSVWKKLVYPLHAFESERFQSVEPRCMKSCLYKRRVSWLSLFRLVFTVFIIWVRRIFFKWPEIRKRGHGLKIEFSILSRFRYMQGHNLRWCMM